MPYKLDGIYLERNGAMNMKLCPFLQRLLSGWIQILLDTEGVIYKEDKTVGRIYNFSAGPAMLPVEVLKEAADEMLDYRGTGMSVMEMSHRSKAYEVIIKEAEKDLRELMNIPDNYNTCKNAKQKYLFVYTVMINHIGKINITIFIKSY